ncbi:hypothetical protein RCH11_002555 [Glaciihabitans sp. GrIS 2.15]|nr:hypothetical protein [Glaciihabitans sp. GrIS 2.15]
MIPSSDRSENIRDLLSELAEDDAEALRPLLLSLHSMSLHSMSLQSAPVTSPELAAKFETGTAAAASGLSTRSRSHIRGLRALVRPARQ